MLVVVTSPERHARVYGMPDGSRGNCALPYDRDGSIGRPAPGRGPDPPYATDQRYRFSLSLSTVRFGSRLIAPSVNGMVTQPDWEKSRVISA